MRNIVYTLALIFLTPAAFGCTSGQVYNQFTQQCITSLTGTISVGGQTCAGCTIPTSYCLGGLALTVSELGIILGDGTFNSDATYNGQVCDSVNGVPTQIGSPGTDPNQTSPTYCFQNDPTSTLAADGTCHIPLPNTGGGVCPQGTQYYANAGDCVVVTTSASATAAGMADLSLGIHNLKASVDAVKTSVDTGFSGLTSTIMPMLESMYFRMGSQYEALQDIKSATVQQNAYLDTIANNLGSTGGTGGTTNVTFDKTGLATETTLTDISGNTNLTYNAIASLGENIIGYMGLNPCWADSESFGCADDLTFVLGESSPPGLSETLDTKFSIFDDADQALKDWLEDDDNIQISTSFDDLNLYSVMPDAQPCTYSVSHRIFGRTFTLAPCHDLAPLRSILAWVFAVLTGFLCFRILFKTTA